MFRIKPVTLKMYYYFIKVKRGAAGFGNIYGHTRIHTDTHTRMHTRANTREYSQTLTVTREYL